VFALKKNAKDWIRAVSLIPVVLLSPLILVIMAFVLPLPFIYISGHVERNQIRNEIFTYVSENKDAIKPKNPNFSQEFFYTATGLQDGGVEYGYYYAPDDNHTLRGEPYRKGYRTYGVPDDDTDWYYSERICENWFYYEIHDG